MKFLYILEQVLVPGLLMSLPSLPVVPTLPWSVKMDGSEYFTMTGENKIIDRLKYLI